MKRSYLAIILILLFSSCYKENELVPTHLETITGKFDFPQGTSPADIIFENIYEKYGVKVIYKEFSESDVNRSWQPPNSSSVLSSSWRWKYVTDQQQIEKAASIFERKVFSILPEDIIRAGARPYPYIYLTDELYPTLSGERVAMFSVKALDGMTVNLEVSNTSTANYKYRVFFPLRIAFEFFMSAYVQEMITVPDAFFQGVGQAGDPLGYTDAVDPDRGGGPGTNRYERFWGRQGFIPFVQSFSGRITLNKTNPHSSSTSTFPPYDSKGAEVAYTFLYLCLDKNWRTHFEPGRILEDCPLLRSRLELFYNLMKDEYGIDFDRIQEILYEGTTIDTSPDRIYDRSKDPDIDLFIYS